MLSPRLLFRCPETARNPKAAFETDAIILCIDEFLCTEGRRVGMTSRLTGVLISREEPGALFHTEPGALEGSLSLVWWASARYVSPLQLYFSLKVDVQESQRAVIVRLL